MQAARLIVCEKSGHWAIAFRHQRDRAGAGPYEVRSLEDAGQALQLSPSSLVAIEATGANMSQVLLWLRHLPLAFPAARAVVLADRGLTACEWLFREAGAVHVVFARRNLAPVAGIVRRHLATAEGEASTFVQRVYAQLPWA